MYKNGLKKEKKEKMMFSSITALLNADLRAKLVPKNQGICHFHPLMRFFSFFFNRAIYIDFTNICTKGEGLKRPRSREMN